MKGLLLMLVGMGLGYWGHDYFGPKPEPEIIYREVSRQTEFSAVQDLRQGSRPAYNRFEGGGQTYDMSRSRPAVGSGDR